MSGSSYGHGVASSPERELYVLLWRKVYCWLLARGPRGDIYWRTGDADPDDESSWTPPGEAIRCMPVLLRPGGPSLMFLGSTWGDVLAIAEAEGILQPDEAAHVRAQFQRREVSVSP